MIGLFGVLTAAALTCASMQQGCIESMETQALAMISAPETVAPIPRAKPLRKSVAKQTFGKTVSRLESSRSDSRSEPPKRKVKVVLQENTRKAKRKPVLLIGNYY